jgi:pimeloyl-ACP methyl ester carboxylesterase
MTGNAGPPLVLVHGSWADQSDWGLVIPAFSRSFRVLAYDRRGHSQSERDTTVDNIEADVSDLAALIETLGLAPAHIVGLSAGGCISLHLATKRPELVRSVAVHEPPLIGLVASDPEHGPLMWDVIARIDAVVARIEAGDAQGGARLFVETLALGPGAWERIPPEWRHLMVDNATTFLGDVRDPKLLFVNLAALAAKAMPTLITSGDQSPAWFGVIVDRLASALPHASRHRFAGAGHLPMVTHVDEYVAVHSVFAATSDAAVAAPVSTASAA